MKSKDPLSEPSITVTYPIAIVSTFLWIGFVCAISFLEAWIKFRAPGVTLPIGLGIGRLVFSVLNKIEWVFAFAISVDLLLTKVPRFSFWLLLCFVPLLLLIVQTIWALPALDARAELHIQHQFVPPSNVHFYYVGMEVAKVLCLIFFGIALFNKSKK